MNILDEQIPDSQRSLLRNWRVPIRQIGYDVGHKGLKDHQNPEFDTSAKRMGRVIRVSSMGLVVWQLHAEQEARFDWMS